MYLCDPKKQDMNESREHLQTLSDIRSMMERSSRFLSLSGLSGVSAGIVALMGAAVVYMRIGPISYPASYYQSLNSSAGRAAADRFFITVALAVLVAALLSGAFFTIRKARRHGQSVWNQTSRRLLWAMLVPLAAGGVFCLILLLHNLIWLAFPGTLIFYGLALLSGSRYTIRDVESLGYCEVGLGLLALFFPGYNLLTWAVGFGVLHIVYGLAMYYKYERNTA